MFKKVWNIFGLPSDFCCLGFPVSKQPQMRWDSSCLLCLSSVQAGFQMTQWVLYHTSVGFFTSQNLIFLWLWWEGFVYAGSGCKWKIILSEVSLHRQSVHRTHNCGWNQPKTARKGETFLFRCIHRERKIFFKGDNSFSFWEVVKPIDLLGGWMVFSLLHSNTSRIRLATFR